MPAKRANNQGSVYKRGSYWVAQITVGYSAEGQQRYKRKGGFRTKTEALEFLPKMKEMASAKPVPTIAYYYKAFCDGKGASISQDKQTAYRIAYQRLQPIHGTPVNELTVPELQQLINSTCSSYYPARDIKVLLNHLFRLAGVDGNANPALPGLLVLPKLNETHRDAFTEEEQIALWLSYEAGNKPAAVPLIMIYTGMMTGEMRHLEASMIDFEKQQIVGAGLKTEERKKKSILIPNDILPLLQDLADQKPEGRIFTQNAEDFYQMYYKALADAGITRHLTPYSCRHTTATALSISANVAPQTVQRLMRWSSTKMLDRYVHPSEQDARNAINSL